MHVCMCTRKCGLEYAHDIDGVAGFECAQWAFPSVWQ